MVSHTFWFLICYTHLPHTHLFWFDPTHTLIELQTSRIPLLRYDMAERHTLHFVAILVSPMDAYAGAARFPTFQHLPYRQSLAS